MPERRSTIIGYRLDTEALNKLLGEEDQGHVISFKRIVFLINDKLRLPSDCLPRYVGKAVGIHGNSRYTRQACF
jgi:hypothetical protein